MVLIKRLNLDIFKYQVYTVEKFSTVAKLKSLQLRNPSQFQNQSLNSLETKSLNFWHGLDQESWSWQFQNSPNSPNSQEILDSFNTQVSTVTIP